MTTLRPPITSLDCREGIIAVPNGSTVQYHDAVTGQVVAHCHDANSAPKSKDFKSVIVRLVAVGHAPATESQSKEVVVASISEDKKLRLVKAKTGELLYERLVQICSRFMKVALTHGTATQDSDQESQYHLYRGRRYRHCGRQSWRCLCVGVHHSVLCEQGN